jgi:hypothetical protein
VNAAGHRTRTPSLSKPAVDAVGQTAADYGSEGRVAAGYRLAYRNWTRPPSPKVTPDVSTCGWGVRVDDFTRSDGAAHEPVATERTSMTNTAPTSDAGQRLGRVTGVAGLAAVVLILVPIVVGTRARNPPSMPPQSRSSPTTDHPTRLRTSSGRSSSPLGWSPSSGSSAH